MYIETKNLETVYPYPKEHSRIEVMLSSPLWFVFQKKLSPDKAYQEYIFILSQIIEKAKKNIYWICNELNASTLLHNENILRSFKLSNAEKIKIIVCELSQINVHNVHIEKGEILTTDKKFEKYLLISDNCILEENFPSQKEIPNEVIFCLNSHIINEAYKNKFLRYWDKLQ